MPTTDDELASKQDFLQKLREQIAAERAKEHDNQLSVANDITAAQLDAEEAKLKAELAEVKARNKVGHLRDASSTLVDSAKEQRKAAQLVEKNVTATGADEGE